MRKKKEQPEEEAGEAWLLPYSDMLTLLLALFIVLFAVSNVDKKKFQQLENEFGTILSNDARPSNKDNKPITSNTSNNSLIKNIDKLTVQKQQEQQLLQRTFEQTSKDIQKSGLTGKVKVSLKTDGIHFTLNSDVLFETESANLTDKMKASLKLLEPNLKPLQNNHIIIAGYTDNLPIKDNKIYKTNWELSASRAISVMNYFVNDNIILHDKVTIQAFADNNPLVENTDLASRAKNRRVEMIIQRIYN